MRAPAPSPAQRALRSPRAKRRTESPPRRRGRRKVRPRLDWLDSRPPEHGMPGRQVDSDITYIGQTLCSPWRTRKFTIHTPDGMVRFTSVHHDGFRSVHPDGAARGLLTAHAFASRQRWSRRNRAAAVTQSQDQLEAPHSESESREDRRTTLGETYTFIASADLVLTRACAPARGLECLNLTSQVM